MDRPVIAALADLQRRHVELSKSCLETMALVVIGMIGARTVNLSHLASEQGNGCMALIST
jgi:hypothetical protein